MALEDIYADLYAVAKHRGPLDEEAVRRATAVLALPRYARASNPAALLVEDLKRVIDTIPDAAVPTDEDDDAEAKRESAVARMGTLARRYFSLEDSGETLTHRRQLRGESKPSGSTAMWRNQGVVYRVIAGLLELQVEVAAAAEEITETDSRLGYRIDSARLLRDIRPHSRLYPTRDTLEFDICLLADGPHLLMLPFPLRHTELVVVATERPSGHPQPQLVSVAAAAASAAAVVFGAQQQPGERVRIQVERRPRLIWRQPPRLLERVSYHVDMPIGELVLQVRPNALRTKFSWSVSARGPVASDEKVVAHPFSNIWGCSNPEIGKTYTLHGARVANPEADRTPEERIADARARARARGHAAQRERG